MTKENYDKILADIDGISLSTVKELQEELRGYLDKCGLFYKIFTRIKSGQSFCKKVTEKAEKKGNEYKIQDLVGIRIAVYFKEDLALCEKLISQYYSVLNVSKNAEDIENFGPQRINYVCEMPVEIVRNFDLKIWEYPIDKSFEIQIRTIFSEGWHEIEHDFRYKCKEEWIENSDLSRTMNGIFATLDNCDWAISSLFTQIAYRHYKVGQWMPMLKNVFKMRIENCEGMDDILMYFDKNKLVAKQFFKLDRDEFLIRLSDMRTKFPLTMKTLIYLANSFQIHDVEIEKMTPRLLKEQMLL